MKSRIKRVSHKARSYARYIVVGLAALLFLSVFRASIFDQYLFDMEGIAHSTSQQENLLRHVETIDPSLVGLLRGADYYKVPGEETVNILRSGRVVASLVIEDGKLYLINDSRKTAVGVSKEENGVMNIYAGITPESEKIWFEISFILLVAISAELLVSYVKQPVVMVLLVLGIISPIV